MKLKKMVGVPYYLEEGDICWIFGTIQTWISLPKYRNNREPDMTIAITLGSKAEVEVEISFYFK